LRERGLRALQESGWKEGGWKESGSLRQGEAGAEAKAAHKPCRRAPGMMQVRHALSRHAIEALMGRLATGQGVNPFLAARQR
jgi:hypothetical protein